MANKTNGTDMSEWVRGPPPSGPLWLTIAKAFYNPEEKSVLGRTPKRWAIAITFYLVFYAVLALMFSLCMGGLFMSLNEARPSYTLDRSLIGSNPGVTARPLPERGEIKIYRDQANSTDEYLKDLDEFFKLYENDAFYKEQTECVRADNFGYPETPCLFVKLNRIMDWEPEYYNDINNLPGDFPADLTEHIKSLDEAQRSQLWVWCFDEHGNSTAVEYPWGRSLAGFLPYQQLDAEHRNPILAVKLTPEVNVHTVIRCRVLAKNVLYNKSIKEARGYARVLIYVEDKEATE